MAEHPIMQALADRRKLSMDSKLQAHITTGLRYLSHANGLGPDDVIVRVSIVTDPEGGATLAHVDDDGALARRTRTATRQRGLIPLAQRARRQLAIAVHVDPEAIVSIDRLDHVGMTCPALPGHVAETVDRLTALLVAADAVGYATEAALADRS